MNAVRRCRSSGMWVRGCFQLMETAEAFEEEVAFEAASKGGRFRCGVSCEKDMGWGKAACVSRGAIGLGVLAGGAGDRGAGGRTGEGGKGYQCRV